MPPRVTPATCTPPLDFNVSSMSLTTCVNGYVSNGDDEEPVVDAAFGGRAGALLVLLNAAALAR